jgi:hypothetical protein
VEEKTLSDLDAALEADLLSRHADKRMAMFTLIHRKGEAIVADSYVFGKNTQYAAKLPYLTYQAWLTFLADPGSPRCNGSSAHSYAPA